MIAQVGDVFALLKPWGGLAAGERLTVHEVRQGGMFFLTHAGNRLAKGWTRADRDIIGLLDPARMEDLWRQHIEKQENKILSNLDPVNHPDIRDRIADEAKRIVSGDRRGAYGTPEDNFQRIARFWTAYMQNTGRDIEITASDVSPLMRLMKEARLCDNPTHLDSHVDLVGYALTGAEVNKVKFPD